MGLLLNVLFCVFQEEICVCTQFLNVQCFSRFLQSEYAALKISASERCCIFRGVCVVCRISKSGPWSINFTAATCLLCWIKFSSQVDFKGYPPAGTTHCRACGIGPCWPLWPNARACTCTRTHTLRTSHPRRPAGGRLAGPDKLKHGFRAVPAPGCPGKSIKNVKQGPFSACHRTPCIWR